MQPATLTQRLRRCQLLYRRSPDYFQELAETGGPVVRLRLGGRTFLLLSSPAAVHDVLVRHAGAFEKGGRHIRARRWLGEGVLMAEGEHHHAQRRQMAPAFREDRLARYAPAMVAHSARLAAGWRDGGAVDLAEALLALSLTVTADTLLGADIRDSALALNSAVAAVATTLHAGSGPWTALTERLPWPTPRPVREAAAQLDAFMDDLIASKLGRPADPPDLLDELLAGCSPGTNGRAYRPVRDQILTLLMAGRETLAASLIWSWQRLGSEPAVEVRLHEELAHVLGERQPALADVPQLRYTRQVWAEALRCDPPAWATGRRAVRACHVAGTDVPAGSVVIMSQYVVHHDPALFADPWRFDPDRWSAQRPIPLPPCAYFPFGAGPRRCLGEGFAAQMAVLHLATIAREWRLRPVSDGPVAVTATTSYQPTHGLLMRTERRRRSGTTSRLGGVLDFGQ